MKSEISDIYDTDFDNLDEDVVEYTKKLLLDFLGVLIGSSALQDAHKPVLSLVRRAGGRKESTVINESRLFPCFSAAFANGSVVHSIEMDDTHSASSTHPGSVVFPAALAVAEKTDSDGRKLIDSVVSGYDLMLRVGEAAGATNMYERGFHPTSVCGVFGSAITSSKLLSLSQEDLFDSLGIAWSFAAGNASFSFGSPTKKIQPGIASSGGIQASLLSKGGYEGPKKIFKGELTFFDSFSGEPEYSKISDGPGEKFKITETGMKPYSCCRYNQSPIDAAIQLKEEHDLDPRDVDKIEVQVVENALPIVAAPKEEKMHPKTREDAQFNLFFSVAVALSEGRAGYEEFSEKMIENDAINRLTRRIRVRGSPEFSEVFPENWPSKVEVELKDGKKLSKFVKTNKGDPSYPLTDVEVEEKFMELARNTFEDEIIEEIKEKVMNLEQIKIGNLTELLRG